MGPKLRLSTRKRQHSPRKVLVQGKGIKSLKAVERGRSRARKRLCVTTDDDSDDSLLLDELAPAIPWAQDGNVSGPPLHGLTARRLSEHIQPLQIDESTSFDDIGGLSEYITALKEMVFLPLLYPNFFETYHITSPRGVLLCGPPGTGKTLVARALASAASKAGQKVTFYMRNGADILSPWVGEAERQLKLLFEEAKRNQPSIIFFDEIDGLAPVRSSRHEQVHNSIVSTLLGLMDGLSSRGQVVLIGATNRVDDIDGALRRPGRFDKEFNFPLPDLEARAEILDIHTRKWGQPPPKELRMELAASCVGYCGADLKALCTEAAIQALREKYPQVYTSNDKLLIRSDTIKIEKYHFLEAMPTITPASRTGSVVQSKPLSLFLAPCLKRHLQDVMNHISDIFPFLSASSDRTKFSVLSNGAAVPLVYRPRVLLFGDEESGLGQIGPAVLHELEKFPIHSLGLSSLLSDPSGKSPEAALVHIFREARKRKPSILYIPKFQLWWESAHDQLKAVLISLLVELPSDFPILLLATSSVPLAEIDGEASSVFAQHHVYQLKKPTLEDRSMFFDRLIGAVFSILSSKSQEPKSNFELPKAPKTRSAPKASELRAQAEAEKHALRRLRMCLRDVCNSILDDKRFTAFHYPVMDEDAPEYHEIIQNPMDMLTLLKHVDGQKITTLKSFLQHVDLISSNAKAYNGEGSRISNRGYELRDTIYGMVLAIDPALVQSCEKIAAQRRTVCVSDVLGGFLFPPVPVRRRSVRLRKVQPEVNQSYETLRQPKKKNTEQAGGSGIQTQSLRHTVESISSSEEQPSETNGLGTRTMGLEAEKEKDNVTGISTVEGEQMEEIQGNKNQANGILVRNQIQVDSIKLKLVKRTEGYGVPQLYRISTRVLKAVLETKKEAKDNSKDSALEFLSRLVEDEMKF